LAGRNDEMPTRAVTYLKKRKLLFEIVQYDHQEKGAAFAAAAVGFPLAQTVKTLVVALGTGARSHCLALMPGDRELDLKKMAGVFGVKRTAMADIADAQRLTGYLVGGISPFATKQRLPAVMEESLLQFDVVLINAGQRGTMVKMRPGDIVRDLDSKVAAIAR
jgi:Cys-tRNA(Pro)/Cys-tRNA(Cys) deacylase